MTPRDYAVEIATLDVNASTYRHEVEVVIRRALADECCRLAAMIDEEDRANRIRFPGEASTICRSKANEHLNQTEAGVRKPFVLSRTDCGPLSD